MVKLLVQNHGSSIAIGIQSDIVDAAARETEIQEQFNSFWNFGATSGELSWQTEDFAYFWTTPENFEKYLVNSSLHRILNESPNKFKGRSGGAMEHARQLAELRKSDFIPEDFRLSETFDPEMFSISEQAVSMLRAEGIVLDNEMPEKVAALYAGKTGI